MIVRTPLPIYAVVYIYSNAMKHLGVAVPPHLLKHSYYYLTSGAPNLYSTTHTDYEIPRARLAE